MCACVFVCMFCECVGGGDAKVIYTHMYSTETIVVHDMHIHVHRQVSPEISPNTCTHILSPLLSPNFIHVYTSTHTCICTCTCTCVPVLVNWGEGCWEEY